MSEPIKLTCEMQIQTCSCGAFYGVPAWLRPEHYTCPACANRRLREMCRKAEDAHEELAARIRTINSLRGVITKLKKQK